MCHPYFISICQKFIRAFRRTYILLNWIIGIEIYTYALHIYIYLSVAMSVCIHARGMTHVAPSPPAPSRRNNSHSFRANFAVLNKTRPRDRTSAFDLNRTRLAIRQPTALSIVANRERKAGLRCKLYFALSGYHNAPPIALLAGNSREKKKYI